MIRLFKDDIEKVVKWAVSTSLGIGQVGIMEKELEEKQQTTYTSHCTVLFNGLLVPNSDLQAHV